MTTKNKLLVSFLATLLLLSTTSCDNSDGVTTRLARVISNQSSFDIQFQVWYQDMLQVEEFLPIGESIRYEGTEYEDLFDGTIDGLGWFGADSMIISVKDSMKLLYMKADSCIQRNPLEFSLGPDTCFGYTFELIDEIEVSTFTFTDADFEDAQVIGD